MTRLEDQPLITLADAADLIGVTTNQLGTMINNGCDLGPIIWKDGQRCIRKSVLETHLNKRIAPTYHNQIPSRWRAKL